MRNFILIVTSLFLITNCVSKQPTPFVLPDQPLPTEERQPSGFFDFLRKREKKTEGGEVLMKCPGCTTPHAPENTIQLETEKSCSADRLYYQDEFKKISDVYKLKRDQFPEAQFPPACVAYVMRSWEAYDQEQKEISECANEESMPKRGKKMACVTPEYAYSTYNAFVDVMDCLDIPQRELLPKIWNESYFHVNTYGAGDDAGVGQLTNDAITEVTKKKYADMDLTEIDFYKKEMAKSNKASCARILAEPTATEVKSSDFSVRCGLMMPASSPLRNIFYTGVFYRVVAERIAGVYYRAGKEVVRTGQGFVEVNEKENTPLSGLVEKYQFKEKMEALGIENPNMTYIKQVLLTLAFNAGSRTAVSLFDDYLKARIANNRPITDLDLDFINADSSQEMVLIKGPKDESEADKAARLLRLEAAREVSYKKPLPNFIRLMQVKGSPGYVSKVGYRGTKFNKEVGDNICTQPSFLQHSSPPKPSQPTE